MSGMASEHTGGWRTMESAPKDGTFILLYLPDKADARHVIGGWHSKFNWTCETWDDFINDAQPTHWMPLPDPPAALALTAGEKA